MGQAQRLYEEMHPYINVESQPWYKEATKGCYNVEKHDNQIYIHFDCSILDNQRAMKNAELHLDSRNISYVPGHDYMYYLRVSYNFKDLIPRRNNSRHRVIMEELAG